MLCFFEVAREELEDLTQEKLLQVFFYNLAQFPLFYVFVDSYGSLRSEPIPSALLVHNRVHFVKGFGLSGVLKEQEVLSVILRKN